jgi:hypothetical protein
MQIVVFANPLSDEAQAAAAQAKLDAEKKK